MGFDRAEPAATEREESTGKRATLKAFLLEAASEEGFDIVKITQPGAIPLAAQRLRQFLAEGQHGTMGWLQEKAERRGDPAVLWPQARSIVMLGLSYAPQDDPLAALAKKSSGNISVYARNRDYHELIKGRLKQIATRFAARTKGEVKVFVDTAPVMEKPLAEAAGIGWQGKHTNLVSRQFGSWLFLGAIFTDAELPIDAPEEEHCGSCRACLDVCPTDAFPSPFRLDARRCISYLTIEHAGPIPREFREKIGNRIYGCDDCLAICPWNKFAAESREAKLAARSEFLAPSLADLARLDDEKFRALFSGSPVKRIGRDRFLRNVLIAIGNSGEAGLAREAERCLSDASPIVRGAAIWALGQLLQPEKFGALRERFLPGESEEEVRGEWLGVLS